MPGGAPCDVRKTAGAWASCPRLEGDRWKPVPRRSRQYKSRTGSPRDLRLSILSSASHAERGSCDDRVRTWLGILPAPRGRALEARASPSSQQTSGIRGLHRLFRTCSSGGAETSEGTLQFRHRDPGGMASAYKARTLPRIARVSQKTSAEAFVEFVARSSDVVASASV